MKERETEGGRGYRVGESEAKEQEAIFFDGCWEEVLQRVRQQGGAGREEGEGRVRKGRDREGREGQGGQEGQGEAGGGKKKYL
jgi:hypothetical protein